MTRRWIWILAGLQIAFFAGWAALEESRVGRDRFLLATEPYDPRDLLSGQYMVLSFPDARLPKGTRRNFKDGDVMLVRFAPAGSVTRNQKEYPLWKSQEHREWAPGDTAQPGWAQGRVENGRIVFGIERYYFSEARAEELNSLRSGQFYVLASLKDGHLRVHDLIW